MWGDPDPDPGGSGETRQESQKPSPQELSDLKDQNEQQVVLIAQLKEMLRKEQSSVSQEKVEEYVNTLNRNKAKRSFRQKKEGPVAANSGSSSSVRIDASKKERINLLRQQMEENKARLAERGKSQKGIEEMVSQLQAQLKDNQTLISSTPLNVSLVETKSLDYNENTPQKDLYNILLIKERKITELMNKSQKLEGTILDLQENLKEKDSVIDARTRAITLMTDSLSKKGKSTLDALDETKEHMRKMQEDFVTLEAEMKARQLTLLNDLKTKNFEISDLQQANSQLEKEKLELEKQLSGFERSEVSIRSSDNDNLVQLRSEIEKLQLENQHYLEKINELEQRPLEETDVHDLQNKFEESCIQNAENISKISRLDLELNEALFKLKSYEENKEFSKDHVKGLEAEKNKLLEEIQRLTSDNLANVQKNSELEKQLDDALTDLKLMRNTGMGDGIKTSHTDNDEITKLKKQLDESNKNMIKMRATQKGKIKELNKKLDQFKKMSDANAFIIQLQNEISKLNEKVAELEDEKGNMQLKMVESTSSSKGDPTELEEQLKDMERKLSIMSQELEEKTKVIDILELEIISLKAELKQKSEEEVKVTTHVSSEMSSINYEEQIENIESEKKKLIEELDAVKREKEELLKEMENLSKEKQDMATKLDNYIQENMDLIDKLEKLSAEKVSSAESIEIVEGLTQQEKLELAAYQKHLNPEDTLKCSDEDNMDPPGELNESVLQLGEDTVELLQKIEMFTQERKEVMLKMEVLKEENNMLSLKIKEIENNKDILEETYEQLQTEKETLANEKQELIEKLEKTQEIEAKNKADDQSVLVLDTKLEELQIKCEALVQENNELKRTLKDFDSKIQEKYDLENQVREMIESNAALEEKLMSNLEEINTYEVKIAENKDELHKSSDLIGELNSKLIDREKDIEELHININDLNNVITELQSKNNNYEQMESELKSLKDALTDQLTQTNDYESEMAQSNETMRTLQNELVQMNRKILELENELELKDSEIQKITKDIDNKDEIIKNLQSEIEEKNGKLKKVSEEMKAKYLSLQKQLDDNGDSVKQQIDDLTTKNKEQLEKMKKIAANLKKKTQAYQQLEEQYKSDREKWESEATEKNYSIQASQEKISSMENELQNLAHQLQFDSEEKIRMQNELIDFKQKVELLEQNNADQQHLIQELKHKQAKLQEVSLQKELSDSLHEEIDTSFTKNVPEDKIRELEMMLETNESELYHYKERIEKFEDTIRTLEEEKTALKRQIVELVEKLDLTSNSFKEKALLEDQLELRLAEVSANDEVLTKKLQETQKEQEEFVKKNQENEELIKKLKIKLKKAHDKVTELKNAQTSLQDLETENQELKNQINTLETNQRHIQNENESLQRRNMSDYEKIEADYQIQLEELLKTKNELIIENEKLLDKLKELEEKEQELNMEIDEYKLRLDQSENSHVEEIDRLNEEIKKTKEELEKSQTESHRFNIELKESQEKLQNSLIEVDSLNHELSNIKDQLADVSELQQNLASSVSEKIELNDKLNQTNEKLEHIETEYDNFKHTSNEKLQASLQENTNLRNENDKLKEEINKIVNSTKSFDETSIRLTQKLDDTFTQPEQQKVFESFFQENINPTHTAFPTFQWPDQQASVDLFDNIIQPQAQFINVEMDGQQRNIRNSDEKSAIEDLKQQLEVALNEAVHLRTELDKLKQEILALQFAKASLEASYESSQKLAGEKWKVPEALALQEFSPENIKYSEEALPKHASACDIFAQTSTNETFAPSASGLGQFSLNLGDSIHQSQPFSPVIEDSREALIKKIKTLEFLLYNIDKEKEVALEQCTEMVNELTQVLYAQANAPRRDETSVFDLESQIMSQEVINKVSLNKKELLKTEYTSVSKDSGEKSAPVEESFERRNVYLCFDDEGSTSKADDLFANLESQVVSNQDIIDAASNKKELQNIEFGRVNRSIGDQLLPVTEPLAQSRNAYLCYTKEDKPQSFEAFEENDDGWGWGPEEARLEEEHISNVENTPQVKSLLLEIQQLKDGIRVLQVERENHLEEIKQLQIKSGKLIKKCKELKAKSDQALSTKKQDDGGFFDLNETIQEELKVQIQQLEKRIKEITNELEKEKLEKGNLLKRVDVLTSANERMIDMKEIQDSEVLRWQRKHQEAVEKLQEYEWSSDGFGERNKISLDETQPSTSGSDSESSRIKELESTIRDLTLDNEELQTLLEEQSARRIEAEKNKLSANNQEVSELRILNENLHRQLNEIKIKCSELQNELDSASREKKGLSEEAAVLEKVLSDNEAKISTLEVDLKAATENKTNENLQNEIIKQKNQLANQEVQLNEKRLIIQDLQMNLEHLNNRKVELELTVTQLREELTSKANSLQSSLEKDDEIKLQNNFLKAKIENINTALAEKEQVIEELNRFIEKEKVENNMLLDQLKTKLGENDEELKLITAERDKKDLECQQASEDIRKKILEIEEYQRMIASLQEHVKEIEVFGAEKSQKAQDNQNLIAELQLKSLEIEEKERIIKDLQVKADENKLLTADREALSEDLNAKIKEVEALLAEKLNREIEIQQLYNSLENKEQEFEARKNSLVNELNENWQVQVDQRGADVAESWKMHLEMVEKDYISEAEKLKSDISELEEKCNILSNENNELRKNVDQEIRNEVDKLSTLQQQISGHLQTISTLNLALLEKDKQIEEIQNNLANYISLENELQDLKRCNIEKETKLASANIIIETTQKQFDEKREVVESIVSNLEKNASSAIPYEKDFILNEFQRQLGRTGEKDNEISRLTQNVAELEAKLNRITGESSREITGLNQIIEDLEKELSVVHEKEAEILRLSTDLHNLQLEKHRLQQELETIRTEKDNLIPEYEKIKNEHMNCQSLVEEYKQKVEDYQNTNLTLQQVLEERNRDINEVNQRLLQMKEEARSDSNKQVEHLSTAVSKAKEDYMILQETLTACQNELEETRRELAQKTEEFDIVTQNLHSYQKYYTDFEEEIRRLKQTLEECQSEYAAKEGHYIEVLSNKDIERQTLQTQMEGFMRQSQEFNERLNQEYVIKQELEHKLNERTQLVDEDTKQLEELRQIIEEQVMKIEELKNELFNKSNQYDSLIAEMDVGRQPVTQQPIASTSVTPLDAAQKEKYLDDDLTEPVSRAELDLALYMLHQRDVRCEELTVELTQLLEERDTLQLRLSNAIREKEELRRTLTDTSVEPTTSSDRDTNSSLSKSSAIFLAASGTELAKDSLESEQNLATKLSELKIVGYKKDKTFVDEQEARRFQQLALMQQHINEASRLPPEAAARLVDASYTLSRDVQSPSKVLLNWLWGKNPPKANDS